MSTIVLTSCFGFVNFVNADTPLFFEVAEGIGNFGAYVSNQIIVKFKEEISDDVISRINSKYGTFVKSVIFNSKLVSLEIPAGKSVFDMLQIYNNDPNVEYAEPNYYAHAAFVPNDQYYPYQWHLDAINMESAWNLETGISDVVVAVVDTGVAYEDYQEYQKAPDLVNTIFMDGYDFINDDSHPNDDASPGHGTHVAGTIAQSTDNGVGVAGVAFGVSIMPVKVLNNKGSGTYAEVAAGIDWAVDHGANIISMSLSGSSPSITLENAVKNAYESGVTVIAAAGNGGTDGIGDSACEYPAAYDKYVIAVGATQYDNSLTSYSNYGLSLDIVAPGGSSLDQNSDGYPDGVLQQTFELTRRGRTIKTSWGYYFMSGTSMATPHVSGVAALLLSVQPSLSPTEIRTILESTATDLGTEGKDIYFGSGLLNAYNALESISGPNVAPDADDNSLVTAEDTPESITLTASDADGDSLIYSIVDEPDHGVLSGTLPIVTYTPDLDYFGGDGFTFKVNDGRADSNIASVSITVNPVNDAPVAISQSVSTDQGVDTVLTLTGNDVEGVALTYSILDWPDHGQLVTEDLPVVTYTSDSDFVGEDSFSFTVKDGELISEAAAIVSITVDDPNAEQPTLNVADVSVEIIVVNSRKSFTKATATVTIVDDDGAPVGGATVEGEWSGMYVGSASGITDANGQVSFTTSLLKNEGTITFIVTGVTKSGWIYTPPES